MRKLISHILLMLVLVPGWLPAGLNGAESDKYPQRISLAISGGASKGAYEAGLNWGALKLLRDFSDTDPILGGQFRPFEAASFAGASAGGINSLLSGITWCSRAEQDGGITNRIGNNIFRDVWLNIDVNRLLPASADSDYYQSDDALLSRHDLRRASNLLREKWHTAAFRDGCQVPLGVTVTRVEPEVLYIGDVKVQNQRFYIPFELYVKPDRTAGFRFNPENYPSLTDASKLTLPTEAGKEPHTLTDQQIETISFASSAFPLAFSRQRLAYCRQTDIRVKQQDENKILPQTEEIIRNMQCPDGYELTEAEFADGGLFDNLPIGLARILAEQRRDSTDNPIPITYLYIDPERLRYEAPETKVKRDCELLNPPAACQQMEYSFLSESGLLIGALGTARKYELYRELTSDYWTNNLSELGYSLANKLKESNADFNCDKQLPYFDKPLKCHEAIRHAGRFLELAYDRIEAPIVSPFSISRLRQADIAISCSKTETKIKVKAECKIDFLSYRKKYALALTNIMRAAKINDTELYRRINISQLSSYSDRVIRVSSLGSPIIGHMLGDFGGFLDFKFREYDYYVGIYDVIVAASSLICSNHFSPTDQGKAYATCFDAVAKRAFETLQLNQDPKGKYVFALLAQEEFGDKNILEFSYNPMPEKDQDIHTIFQGLRTTLASGHIKPDEKQSAFYVEKAFFEYLTQQGFNPTPTQEGGQPLLAQIMDDPDQWSYELVNRITNRLVYLEQQAEVVFQARESDPDKQEHAYPGLLGAGAYILRTTSYKYPQFAFSPSTAPDHWAWRNFIPYEFGFDLAEGDLLLSWQPTWSLSKKNTLGIRATIGFAGGLLNSSEVVERENYLSLGLDYSHMTRSGLLSSWGITPYWFHTIKEPDIGKQDTFGADMHVGLLENRLRIGLGARDVNDMGDTWFLVVGVTDIPGLVYWLTR